MNRNRNLTWIHRGPSGPGSGRSRGPRVNPRLGLGPLTGGSTLLQQTMPSRGFSREPPPAPWPHSMWRREVRERRTERDVVRAHIVRLEPRARVVRVEERAEDGVQPGVDDVVRELAAAPAVGERPRKPAGSRRILVG